MTDNYDNLGLATILKEMEEAISTASKVPLSSKIMLDADSMMDYVDKIYAALPEELKKAQRVLEHSDILLEKVEDRSKKIIYEAREQAQQLTAETEIYREATSRAREMMERTEKACIELRHESVMYCYDVLGQLEENIEACLNSVKQNRADLRNFKYFNVDDLDLRQDEDDEEEQVG